MGSVSFWQAEAGAQPFPSLEGSREADVVIVGGGITGAAVALWLARAGISAVLLEGRQVAAGASGRNGGFLLGGTSESYATARARYGPELACRIWTYSAANNALAVQLAADLADHGWPTGFERNGSLRIALSPEELADIEASVRLLNADGWAAEVVARDALPATLRAAYLGASFHPLDGEIQPVRFVRGIARLAQEAGAAIYEESPALALTVSERGVTARTPGGDVRASALVLATNAWLTESGPLLGADWLAQTIAPTRGQMLATEVAPQRLFPCPCYADHGYQYWRQTPDGRLVVGGWRNQSVATEVGLDETPGQTIQPHLDAFVHKTLGLPALAIAQRWAGVMAFSRDGLPLIGRLPGVANTYLAGGYTGHGNAYALMAAQTLAATIQGKAHAEADLFSPQRFADAATRA